MMPIFFVGGKYTTTPLSLPLTTTLCMCASIKLRVRAGAPAVFGQALMMIFTRTTDGRVTLTGGE